MAGWVQDTLYGARMLIKRPGTTGIAVVALALGIGLTTTMFSIVQGAILRGLPFDDSERIMYVGRARLDQRQDRLQSTPVHDFIHWRDHQQSFERLAAFSGTQAIVAESGTFPERLRGTRITPNTLELLRVTPAHGRDFDDNDAAVGAPPVVIISHRLWLSRYRGDPAVLGRVVRVNNAPATIVGVMPERFGFPQAGDVWLPQAITPPAKRGSGSLQVFGRLKGGVTEEQATAEIAGLARQLAETYPENKNWTALPMPYIRQFLENEVISTLFTMLAAVFGVMLIACVNVTNLQLARAAERTKEVAIRSALGAGRWRIVRQLLLEGLLLAGVGALLGLAIARAGIAVFNRNIMDTTPPFWIDIRLDPTVLLFVTVVTAAAALVSSLVPAWRVSRTDANAVLKDDARGSTSVRMGRFSRGLVVVEVAVSCILLIVSGLMIRSIVANTRLSYPFATEDVFRASVTVDEQTFPKPADINRVLDQIGERLARIPGVRHVAFANGVPTQSGGSSVAVEGHTYPPDGESGQLRLPEVAVIHATPGFFDVLRISLRHGRLFTAAETEGTPPVAVVDEAFVRRHFPTGAALGQRLKFGTAPTAQWHTVIGIVSDTSTDASRDDGPVGLAYLPLAQSPGRGGLVLASTTGDPVALTPAVRAAVLDVSDSIPVSAPNSLAGEFWRQGWAFRVFGGLFLTFGLAALLLAGAGLYGVMAFTVRRRTAEIGVRMALGASQRRVLGTILWQGLWRVALGIAIGIGPGWFVGGLMEALLEDVAPSDPLVHASTVGTLLIAGTLACLVPARRAASVDPIIALRSE